MACSVALAAKHSPAWSPERVAQSQADSPPRAADRVTDEGYGLLIVPPDHRDRKVRGMVLWGVSMSPVGGGAIFPVGENCALNRFARRGVALAAMCIALGLMLCNAPGSAAAADLRVTVQTPVGQPDGSAIVCAGVPQNPAQYGSVSTSASGVAVLRNLPSGTVQITVQSGANGRVLTHQMSSGSQQQAVVIRLPISPTPQRCGTQGGPPISSPSPGQPQSESPSRFRPQLGDARPPSGKLQPIAPGRITPPKVEHCFGALGAQCGLPQVSIPTTALCASGKCQINAGSWEHDECCFAHPDGMACTAGPLDYVTGHNGRCVNEWNKALSHLSAGLNWTRQIDFTRGNSSGRVNFTEYCAPKGTHVLSEDVRYCCSRQADTVSPPPGMLRIASPLRRCQ